MTRVIIWFTERSRIGQEEADRLGDWSEDCTEENS